MKFKSPNDTPIQVALLSGHTAVVGTEWRDLPINLHRKALELGCITDNMDAATIAQKVEHANPQRSNHDILMDTIKSMMQNPKQGDFTGADLPNLKTLSLKVGWTVKKEEMMRAVQAISDEPDAEDGVIEID